MKKISEISILKFMLHRTKKILSFLIYFYVTFTFAQLSCDNAIPITVNGNITVPNILGACKKGCFLIYGTYPKGIWYKYTASSNGEVRINANLPLNVAPFSQDQRVSIFKGSCTDLTCYGSQDDISSTNFSVDYTFPVAMGTTYYIQWDDRWDGRGFVFNFNFTPLSCTRVSDSCAMTPTNVTTNSATISWEPAIGSPEGYMVTFPNQNINIATNSTSISVTDLPEDSNTTYCLSTFCGGQTTHFSCFDLFLAHSLPYSNNFDTDFFENSFNSSKWELNESVSYEPSHSGDLHYISFYNKTFDTNDNLYSRALYIESNQLVNLSFYTRRDNNTYYTPQVLKIFVNTIPSEVGAIQIGSDITVTERNYTLKTLNYLSPSNGIYYFIFKNATPSGGNYDTTLYLDTFSISSVLGLNDEIFSNFSVFPNPATNFIKITNTQNLFIQSLEIIDLNGRIVKMVKINATEGRITIDELKTGIYIIKIITDDGFVFKKILKQ